MAAKKQPTKFDSSFITGSTRSAAQRVQLPAAPATGGDEFPATAAAAGDEPIQGATEQQSLQSLNEAARKGRKKIAIASLLFHNYLSFLNCPPLCKARDLRVLTAATESEYNIPYHTMQDEAEVA